MHTQSEKQGCTHIKSDCTEVVTFTTGKACSVGKPCIQQLCSCKQRAEICGMIQGQRHGWDFCLYFGASRQD